MFKWSKPTSVTATGSAVDSLRGPRALRSNLVGESGNLRGGGYQMEMSDIEPIDVIGQGAFGVIHKVRDKNTGQQRVMKTVVRPQGWDDERMKLEAQILQNLDHPHILRIFAWYEDGDAINIVMEHCAGGELTQTVRLGKRRGEELPEAWVATAMGQCLEALVYIHSKGVAHKDLKSQNLLLLLSTETPDGRIFGCDPHVVICDLGIAEVLNSTAFGLGDLRGHKVAGTPATMAPEVWTGNCGPKCDIWSMGCVMYEIFTNRMPFDVSGSVNALAKKSPKWLDTFKAGPNWENMKVSKEARSFNALLLTFKESLRPTAAEALKHKWFAIRAEDNLTGTELQMLVDAVSLWPNRSPMQRAMCLKMAVGCTCISKFARVFTNFDKDNSGTLDHAEVVLALQGVGLKKTEAKRCAAALDINGDGSCEYIEFSAACLCLLEDQFDELLHLEFLQLDKRQKNYLTSREMAPLLNELKPICESHGMQIEDIDKDGDGNITFAEFCAYFGRVGKEYGEKPDRREADPTSPKRSSLPMKEHIRLVRNEQTLRDVERSFEKSFEARNSQELQKSRAKQEESKACKAEGRTPSKGSKGSAPSPKRNGQSSPARFTNFSNGGEIQDFAPASRQISSNSISTATSKDSKGKDRKDASRFRNKERDDSPQQWESEGAASQKSPSRPRSKPKRKASGSPGKKYASCNSASKAFSSLEDVIGVWTYRYGQYEIKSLCEGVDGEFFYQETFKNGSGGASGILTQTTGGEWLLGRLDRNGQMWGFIRIRSEGKNRLQSNFRKSQDIEWEKSQKLIATRQEPKESTRLPCSQDQNLRSTSSRDGSAARRGDRPGKQSA
jgi:serine/threonine protein kinase